MGLLMTAFVFPYGASVMLFSVTADVFGPRKTLSAIAGDFRERHGIHGNGQLL